MAFRTDPPLILASGSPRRRELLAGMGYAFDVCVPDVDEHLTGSARDIVLALARLKAQTAASNYDRGVIIASDTLVSLNNMPLGKPADEKEARRMLQTLSGREHDVFTGVCLLDVRTGRTQTCVVRTGVSFRSLSGEEIDAYVATGEPMDKAGAYAIQGGAGAFVSRLDGELENVIGFPVAEIRQMLGQFVRAIPDS